MWQLGANVDPGRDVLVSSGPLDQLDHAPNIQSLGGKIGFDATAKWPSEGYAREWPEVARMTAEVQERVTARWPELGIALAADAAAPAGGRRREGRSGLLRRRRT